MSKRNISVHKKKRARRVVTSTKRDFTFFNSILLFIIAFLLILLSFESFHTPVQRKVLASESTGKMVPSTSSTPTPTVSDTPTSSPTATITPTVSKDYCIDAPIFIYHHIQPYAQAQTLGHAQLTVDASIFDSQVAYLLAHNYRIVSIDEIVNALLSQKPYPAKSVAITIDDGYDDAYNYVLPILKKYAIVANFMIPSGLIGNNGYMTWAQLKELNDSGHAFMYNHTFSHSALGSDDVTKINYELDTSMKQLSDNLGIKQTTFVYPYGSYSPQAIQILIQKGFTAGLSTLPGRQQCQSFIMTLHRDHIGNAPLYDYGY